MAVSARFGQVGLGREGFSVRFSANELIRLTDSVTGKFRGGAFQNALSNVHSRSALLIQEGMVKELNKKVSETGRHQRPGNRLALSLLDERNRDVTSSSFIVGRESWLEQSPAELYWRRIEEGDRQTFTARVFFTNNATGSIGHGPPYYAPFTAGTGLGRYPAGYKHARMPQVGRGVLVQGVGPFPAYKYSRGGSKAMRSIDFSGAYQTELRRYGLEMAKRKG